MSALEGFEDLIRDKIENKRWTHKQISTFLMESYPGQRGFSVRSIERFCGNKGIHKTSRIDDRSLDVAVSTATAMVRSILRVDRLPYYYNNLHAAVIMLSFLCSSTPFFTHALHARIIIIKYNHIPSLKILLKHAGRSSIR